MFTALATTITARVRLIADWTSISIFAQRLSGIATAFSPTDTMPLSRWAKMLMLVQSAISLTLAVMVVARAVNILS